MYVCACVCWWVGACVSFPSISPSTFLCLNFRLFSVTEKKFLAKIFDSFVEEPLRCDATRRDEMLLVFRSLSESRVEEKNKFKRCLCVFLTSLKIPPLYPI